MADDKNLTKQEVRYLFKKIDRKIKNLTPDTEVGGLPNELLQNIDDLPLTLAGVDQKMNALGGLTTQEIINQIDSQRENAGLRKIRYNRLKDALEHPEAAGILNIYADEATCEDENGEILHVIHPDEEVRETVENMYTRLGIYDKAWGIIRNTCGFGDEFYEVIISRSARRILKIVQLQREFIRRIELNGDLIGFTLLDEDSYTSSMDVNSNGFYLRQINFNTEKEKEDKIFYPFRILHFKIPSSKYGVYGEAVIDSVLSSLEQLSMMEKALLIARITRAPERRIFNIDVGNLTGEQAMRYVRHVMDNFRNRKRLDLYTKREIDYQKDIFGNTEDIAIPKRAGQEGNSITTLDQLNNPGDTGDLEFIRDKIFPGVGIPRQYLFDDTFANANTNLSSKSILFAKRIRRIQRYFLYQMYKLAFIELKLQGFKNDVIKDLIIVMNNPSNIDDKDRLEIETNRWNLIAAIKGNNAETIFYPDYLIYKDILKMNDADIVQLMKLAQLQAAGKNIFMAMPEEDRPEGAEDLAEQMPMGGAGGEAGMAGGGGMPGAPMPGPEGGVPAEGEAGAEGVPTEGGEPGAEAAPGAEGGAEAGGEAGAQGNTPPLPGGVVKQLGPAPETASYEMPVRDKTIVYTEAQNKKDKFIQLVKSKKIHNYFEAVEKEKEKEEYNQMVRSRFSYEEFLISGELKGLNTMVESILKSYED